MQEPPPETAHVGDDPQRKQGYIPGLPGLVQSTGHCSTQDPGLEIRDTWIGWRNHLVDKHLLHEEGINSFSCMAMPRAGFMWVWIPDHERSPMGSLELIKNLLM